MLPKAEPRRCERARGRDDDEEGGKDGEHIINEEVARHTGAGKDPQRHDDPHQDHKGDVDVPY